MFFHSEWKTWSKYPRFVPIRSITLTDQISKFIHENSLAQRDEHDENIFESRFHIFF